MSITEDIFSNNIMGSVTVYDSQDIRTLLPITGLKDYHLNLTHQVYLVMICQRTMAFSNIQSR